MVGGPDGYLLPRPLQALERWPRSRIVVVAVLLSIVLGIVDWLTGPQFSFTIFCLVPVARRRGAGGAVHASEPLPVAPRQRGALRDLLRQAPRGGRRNPCAQRRTQPALDPPRRRQRRATRRRRPGIGVFPDRSFEEAERPLHPKDRVILYTDGVSESWNAGEEFGEDRIVAAARGAQWAGAEETQRRILKALDGFARGDYRDDVTTVVLSVRPNGTHEVRSS